MGDPDRGRPGTGQISERPGPLQDALRWIQGLGPMGWVIFVLLYIAATVLLLPAVVLTLGAGAIFGILKGWIIVSTAATLGATSAFLIGRYFARGWVARRIEASQTSGHRQGGRSRGLEDRRIDPAFARVSVYSPELRLQRHAGLAPPVHPRIYDRDDAGDIVVRLPRLPRSRPCRRWRPGTSGRQPSGRFTVWGSSRLRR